MFRSVGGRDTIAPNAPRSAILSSKPTASTQPGPGGLCPHCRRTGVKRRWPGTLPLRVVSYRSVAFRQRLLVQAQRDSDLVKDAAVSDPKGLRKLSTLVERIQTSLSRLKFMKGRSGPLFPVPKHWARQTGKLSRGARRRLESYYAIVSKVNALEPEMQELDDDELRAKTEDFKQRVQGGESLESLMPEAFAVVREASQRVLEMRHYDCQLVGGVVLHEGQIAEMDTGEGKTLVATLAVYLNALKGGEVHVVTVNEYLATRDAQWMGKIYNLLGLTVSAIKEEMDVFEKKEAYKQDVVYVTAQQLCFDYLGDWSATSEDRLVLRDLGYAIVDEVDSILLDESRTPMILSDKAMGPTEKVELAAKVCHELLVKRGYKLVNDLGAVMDGIKQPQRVLRKGDISATDITKVQEGLLLLQRIIIETSFLNKDSIAAGKGLVEYLDELRRGTELRDPAVFRNAIDLVLTFEQSIKCEVICKLEAQSRKVTITERGARLCRGLLEFHGEPFAGDSSVCLWEGSPGGSGRTSNQAWGPYLTNAFKAAEFYIKGRDYIVSDGRVIIIDESTGRMRERSRYEEGLHQALEAKEKVLQEHARTTNGSDPDGRPQETPVDIQPENFTIASVTFQVFFRYYAKLSGMSGTALVEQEEFFENYGLNVVRIPTHKPPKRTDHPSVIFTEPGRKMDALIFQLAKNGVRPVLIGTNSIEESEIILNYLKTDLSFDGEGVPNLRWDGETRYKAGKVLMLNARPEVVKAESQIVAQAGLPGIVTIATRMAGRGTDIVLGGNPRGLAESAVYRLVFPSLVQPEEGGGMPQIPLPQFSETKDPITTLPESLKGHIHACTLRSTSGEQSLATLDDVQHTMSGVMDIAERIRLLVMKELRPRMEKKRCRISDLDFESDIRSFISTVFGQNEELLEKESGLRQKLIETALYAWLWFEQQCEIYGDQVREAGGLLVVGMSLAESQRIEDQLRGRAGRQGDPGDSMMFSDLSDPMFKMWAFQGVTKILRMNDQLLGGSLVGPEANTIINMMRSVPDTMNRRARRELRQYDEVMEDFRQQLSYLRDIILRGNHQQRTQMVYSWLQDSADSFVDQYCSRTEHPSKWKVFGVRRKATMGPELAKLVPETLDECETIEEAVEMVFNPSNNTYTLPVPNFTKRMTGLLAKAVDMSPDDLKRGGLDLFMSASGSPEGQEDVVKLKAPLTRVIVFTREIQDDLRELLASGKPPVRTPAQHFVGNFNRQPITIELRHALTVRQEMLRQQKHDDRETIRGRNRKQLALLSEYLGELMIMLFEERKTQVIETLCREDDHLILDARNSFKTRQKAIMLDLLDLFWADFLSFTKRLKRTTSVRAFTRASPLEEFTIEANREFASTLDQFRKSVVLSLAAPHFTLTPDSSYQMQRELLRSKRKEEREAALALARSLEEASPRQADPDKDSSDLEEEMDVHGDIAWDEKKDEGNSGENGKNGSSETLKKSNSKRMQQ
ncbi:hypothetical protein BSKO_01371 [Bryopsis sp. KO-2023]|nr:hypothetical protein BSKO_01371 [Bryopsis sp. KO-2023]